MGGLIDWEKLAEELGLEAPYGEYCCGSTDAQRALELLIGEDNLRASVDYYVEHRRGYELARSVLWQLRPWSAMSRCWEIYKGPGDIEVRRAAVELLRVVADQRAMPWIPEFLEDADAEVQLWGAGVLDQLFWSELIEPGDGENLLRAAEQHGNESVRERAAFIRSYLRSRTEARESGEGDEATEDE
jgi:hypothetical protein